MNDSDRIFLLEEALDQAAHTIEFLHECLVNPHIDGVPGGFSYAYPEQTADRIDMIRKLVPAREMDFHSRFYPDCPMCIDRMERFARHNRIEAGLSVGPHFEPYAGQELKKYPDCIHCELPIHLHRQNGECVRVWQDT